MSGACDGGIVPLSPAQTAVQEAGAKREGYLLRVLVALDTAANVALGGSEDETISTNAALMARKHACVGTVVSRMLSLFQANHGAKSAAGDLQRAEAVAAKLRGSGVVAAP